MATEVIIAEYEAHNEKFLQETRAAISVVKQLDAATEKADAQLRRMGNDSAASSAKTTSALKSSIQAYKEQDGVINKLRVSVQQLMAMRDKSNSPALITRYNKLIDEQNAKLRQLTATEQKSNQVRATGQTPKPGFGSNLSQLGGSLGQAGAVLGITVGAQTLLTEGKEAIDAASDFNEEVAKSGEVFGSSAAQVQKFADTAATSFGQSKTEALQAAANFGVFAKAAGLGGDEAAKFSTDFVGLASDLASFNNTSPEEAIQAIGAALRGEAEPIRRYGVLLDDATLRQEAVRLGLIKTTKEGLTPQNRVLAAQAAIYKQTTLAQGDFARTSDGLANQQRILAARYKDLQVTLGMELLPAVLDVTSALNALFEGDYTKFFDSFSDFTEKVNPLGLGIGGLVNAIDNVNKAFAFFEEGKYWKGIERLGTAFIDVQGSANPLIGGVRLLGEQLGLFDEKLAAADESLMRNVAINNTWRNALESGGDALEKFYQKANEAYGITRDQFDKYVAAERAKMKTDAEDNKQIQEKTTYLQALNKELAAYVSKVQNVVAQGGIVKQSDVDRIIQLQDQIKLAAQEYEALIQRTRDRRGFAAAPGVSLSSVGIDNQQETDAEIEARLMGKTAQDTEEFLAQQRERYKKYNEDRQQFLSQYAETDLERAEFQYNAELSALQDALDKRIIAESDYLEIRKKLYEDYSNFQVQVEAQNAANLIGVLNESVGGIAQIYSALANDAEENANFQKAIAIFDASLKLGQAIASGVATAASAGDPYTIAARVAAAAASIAAALAGVITSIKSATVPTAPSFYHGTEYLQRGNNPVGIDTIPVMANEGEAIITTKQNKKYPGLARAWNAGKLEEYIQTNFAAPMIEEGRKKMEDYNRKKLAEQITLSIKNGFDDKRLLNAALGQNEILSVIADNTKRSTNNKRSLI